MRFIILPLFLLFSANTFAQRKSYSSDINEIKNIQSVFFGCTAEHCLSSITIALKAPSELLLQSCGEGFESNFLIIGKWRIYGDTLKLNISPKFKSLNCLSSEYKMVIIYDCPVLLPKDTTINQSELLKNIKEEFEKSLQVENQMNFSKDLIFKIFQEFMREYTVNYKILISREK